MQGRACKQYIFLSYDTSTFSAVRCDENPFTRQCEKEDKKAEGFQISYFSGSYSNDIMAVKGLSIAYVRHAAVRTDVSLSRTLSHTEDWAVDFWRARLPLR